MKQKIKFCAGARLCQQTFSLGAECAPGALGIPELRPIGGELLQ